MEGYKTSPGVSLVGICHLPDVPTAEIINDLAIRILDIPPLNNIDTRLVDEPLYIEDIAKWYGISPTDMGWREHRDYRDTASNDAEVDEVHVSHDVVRYKTRRVAVSDSGVVYTKDGARTPPSRDPGCDVLHIFA